MIGRRRQVLLMALRTHWTRRQILALPRAEFETYMRELTAGNE